MGTIYTTNKGKPLQKYVTTVVQSETNLWRQSSLVGVEAKAYTFVATWTMEHLTEKARVNQKNT